MLTRRLLCAINMSTILTLSALYTGFVAFAAFLFGQVFLDSYSFVSSLVGFAGLATSVGAFKLASRQGRAPAWIMWVSCLALAGIMADAAKYYMRLAVPGNNYAWELMVPFAACLALVGFTASFRRRQHSASGKP